MDSKSLDLAKEYLGKVVTIKIDRPLGSTHPHFEKLIYKVNYGYIDGVKAPDGDDLDVYLLKVDLPVAEYTGKVVAIVHRLQDDDDKLVVIPEDMEITDTEIEESIEFQEKWAKGGHKIIR